MTNPLNPEDLTDSTPNLRISLDALTSPRFQKAVATYTVGTTAYKWAKRQRDIYRSRHSYQVLVHGGTDLYRAAEAWLVSQVPSRHQRSVSAVVPPGGRTPSEEMIERITKRARPRRPTRTIMVAFDGSIEQKVNVDGHEIRVSTYDEASPSGVSVDVSSVQSFKTNMRTIKFICPTEEARVAVLEMLQQELHKQDSVDTRCYVLNQWGDWQRRDYMARRPLETVYMSAGVVEGLRSDLDLFLTAETDYLRLGMPWHRGYLFSGPAGTGKTSLARGLAHEYDLDMYMMSLPDIEKDTNLSGAFASIEAPALLLIEDIDVSAAATTREEHFATVSLSGLLNALDGVGTPHGLICVMTSNHPEKLDSALVRSGRVDREIHCDRLDNDTFRRLVEGIVGQVPQFNLREPVAAADVMEIIKRQLRDDPNEILYTLEKTYGPTLIKNNT